MNTFMNQLTNDTNYGYTENGGLKHTSLNNPVYDMFAFGASYRKRSDEDCILLFKNAFEFDSTLALKCLFWIRDCRGGAGERRFFRICLKWLAENYPKRLRNVIQYVPEYGRYDDWFELFDTPIEEDVIGLIRDQLMGDMLSEKNAISLLAKWMPSENASSRVTIARAKRIRKALNMTAKEYRKMLSRLREKINVLERLMSANEWEKIEFDKIPSKAGLIYKNAFARRDIIAKKYETFAKDKSTKVNAGTLYPYEVVNKAIHSYFRNVDNVDRLMINKYWDSMPDYLNGKELNMMCVVDTSGSMTGWDAAAPINVAIGLGMYCAERLGGPFKDHYISFASRPQLIKIQGADFVDKVKRIYNTNLCDNTNLEAVFDLLLNTAIKTGVYDEDIPKTIVVISDMEIDDATSNYWNSTSYKKWTQKSSATMMEVMRKKWEAYGLTLPHLIYWNVDARHDTILDMGPNVSFVSGASASIFKQVVTGKSGYDLMLETLLCERYKNIK